MTEKQIQSKRIKELESQGFYVIKLIKTNKKINWNSTLAQIKEAYGEPIKYYSGKEIWLPDQTKTEGSYERLEYNGINFRFENNKLVRIGIRKQSKP